MLRNYAQKMYVIIRDFKGLDGQILVVFIAKIVDILISIKYETMRKMMCLTKENNNYCII